MTNQSAVDAAAILRGMANGLRVSQALLVAAELGLADYLSKRPHDGFELATATGADPAALGRVMRALCALGVFSELQSGHFSLKSAGQFLRSEVPGSYRAGVLFHTGAVRWRCWSELLQTVKTGTSATERLLGKQLFDFYAGDAAESKIHDEAMRAFSASHAKILLDVIDFHRIGMAVDVGGGTGELLAAILSENPDLRGVLFDRPNVVKHNVLNKFADRCTVEGGSFFERVPGNGDLYLLKNIVHDWDDESVQAILGCCRRCMPANSRLVIIERKLPELAEPKADVEAFLTDLEMLVMTSGGRERTESEFRILLANAGFELLKVMPTSSPLFILEARPA
jgi:hypothetical protein